MDDQSILHPAPRRSGPAGFTLKPLSTTSSEGTPRSSISEPRHSSDSQRETCLTTPSSTEPHKSRSVLNLTSSTLFGIYGQGSGYDTAPGSTRGENEGMNTPWGTGAQTPQISSGEEKDYNMPVTAIRLVERPEAYITPKDDSKNAPPPNNLNGGEHQKRRRLSHRNSSSHTIKSIQSHHQKARLALRASTRSAVLCLIGLAYGSIITQLQNTRGIALVEVKNLDRASWGYLGFWGLCGLVLGNLLPWVDQLSGTRGLQSGRRGGADVGSSGEKKTQHKRHASENNGDRTSSPASNRGSLGTYWNPIVRSIGAFVGIAFAIRRLPWQSTLQLSLTLALADPVIWYLLDRSRNGFILSTIFALTGASALLTINPAMLPSPIARVMPLVGGAVDAHGNGTAGSVGVLGGTGGEYEGIAVATWIASVLFVSCVCFGNIGRRLAEGDSGDGEAVVEGR